MSKESKPDYVLCIQHRKINHAIHPDISKEEEKLIDKAIVGCELVGLVSEECKNAFEAILNLYIEELINQDISNVKGIIKQILTKYPTPDELRKSIKRVDIKSPKGKKGIKLGKHTIFEM